MNKASEARSWDLRNLESPNLERDYASLRHLSFNFSNETIGVAPLPSDIQLHEILIKYLIAEAALDDVDSYLSLRAHIHPSESVFEEMLLSMQTTTAELDQFLRIWLASIPEAHFVSTINSPLFANRKAWLLKKHADSTDYLNSNPEKTAAYWTSIEKPRTVYTNEFDSLSINHPISNKTLNIHSAMVSRYDENDKSARRELRTRVRDSLVTFMPNASILLERIYKLRAENEKKDAFNDKLSDMSITPVAWDLFIQTAKTYKSILTMHHNNKSLLLGFQPDLDDPIDLKASRSEPDLCFDETIKHIELAWSDISPELGEIIRLVNDKNHIFTNRPDSKSTNATYHWLGNPLISLNWNGDLANANTLAHELGHAIHGFLRHKHDALEHSTNSIILETIAFFSELLFKKHQVETKLINPDQVHQHKIGNRFSDIYTTLARIEFENNLLNLVRNSVALNTEIITQTYEGSLLEWGQDNSAQNYSYAWPSLTHVFKYSYQNLNYLFPRILSYSLFNTYLNAKETHTIPAFSKNLIKMMSLSDSHTPQEILMTGELDTSNHKTWEYGLKLMSAPIVNLHNELTTK
ncbi:hypothetical protein KBD69_02635 [Candidatus Woesebacteria bacterium]|nr:hypothetical protein [Candidatus Woesebacteria bacterium]